MQVYRFNQDGTEKVSKNLSLLSNFSFHRVIWRFRVTCLFIFKYTGPRTFSWIRNYLFGIRIRNYLFGIWIRNYLFGIRIRNYLFKIWIRNYLFGIRIRNERADKLKCFLILVTGQREKFKIKETV